MATTTLHSVLLLFLCLSLISVQRVVAGPQTQGVLAQSAGKGNYTVSFVPLISVIANLFPRLLTRFSPQVQQARGHLENTGVDGSAVAAVTSESATCDHLVPYELRWPDPKNRHQFLYCYPDPVCQHLSQGKCGPMA